MSAVRDSLIARTDSTTLKVLSLCCCHGSNLVCWLSHVDTSPRTYRPYFVPVSPGPFVCLGGQVRNFHLHLLFRPSFWTGHLPAFPTMHFQSLALVAAGLATGAVADTLTVYNQCLSNWGGPHYCSSWKSLWWNDFGQSFEFDAISGCRNPNVPGVVEICMDWPQSRGSFRTTGGNRRCFQKKAWRGMSRPCTTIIESDNFQDFCLLSEGVASY
jgi:hypothetical protein